MPDVKEVIKGLEMMLEESKYNDSVQYNPWADTETLEAALALLKAQESVEPIMRRVVFEYDTFSDAENKMYCPKCKMELLTRVNYCPKCGQAVKWNE